MAQRNGNYVDENGKAVEGAEVYVYNKDGTTATLTDTDDQPITHPVITDQEGNYAYRAADGYYLEHVWFGKRRVRIENGIFIGDPNLSLQLANEAVIIAAQAVDGQVAAAEAAATEATTKANEADAARAAAVVAKEAAEAAETGAEAAYTSAQAAALAATALSAGRVFASTAAGISGTVDTNPFMVPDGSTGNLALWLNVSGVATAVGTPQFVMLGQAGYAALAGQAPSYANAGGQGNRTATVTVTASGFTASGGTPDNLVDGVAASTTGDGYRLPGSTAVAGLIINFNFGPVARKLVTEATTKFQSTNSLGTWKWQGTKDGVTWTDIGSSFTLGSATTQVMTELSANLIGYRDYRWLGVSGSTSATLNYIQEVEFKIAETAADGIVAMPTGGAIGQTLAKTGATDGAAAWIDPKEPPGRELFDYLWLMDEGHGTILRDAKGGANFDLAGGATQVNIGSGGSIAWVDGELVLTNAAVAALAVNACAFFACYDMVPDVTTQYIAAHYNGSNSAQAASAIKTATTTKLRQLHGKGIKDANVTGGTSQLVGFNHGGTSGAWFERSSAASGAFVLNANRNTDWAGMISSPITFLCAGAKNVAPTLSEAKIMRNFLDWHLAKRGRQLTGKYAPKRCAIALWTGESTHHTSLVMDAEPLLTEAMRKQSFPKMKVYVAEGPAATSPIRPLQQLTYWRDQLALGYQSGNEGVSDDRARKMGPCYGFALKDSYRPTQVEQEIITFKVAQGGKVHAPAGSALAAGGTVAVADTFYNNGDGATLFGNLVLKGFAKFEADLRRQGYGYDYVYDFWALGINDANDLASGVIANAAAYQAWLQAYHDGKKKRLGVDPFPTFLLVPHLPVPGNPETYAGQLGQPGVTGYANNAAGMVALDNLLMIRTACRNLDTANADITAVEGDLYGTNIANGDSVHMPFTGMATYGGDCRMRVTFATRVTEYFEP